LLGTKTDAVHSDPLVCLVLPAVQRTTLDNNISFLEEASLSVLEDESQSSLGDDSVIDRDRPMHWDESAGRHIEDSECRPVGTDDFRISLDLVYPFACGDFAVDDGGMLAGAVEVGDGGEDLGVPEEWLEDLIVHDDGLAIRGVTGDDAPNVWIRAQFLRWVCESCVGIGVRVGRHVCIECSCICGLHG